jgi:hypothetical protein
MYPTKNQGVCIMGKVGYNRNIVEKEIKKIGLDLEAVQRYFTATDEASVYFGALDLLESTKRLVNASKAFSKVNLDTDIHVEEQ